MKLSDRDKLLILGVVFIALIALPIFLFIRPKNEKIKGLETELEGLNERYVYLKDLSDKQPFYESEIERLKNERTALIDGFAGGLKQENTIMFLRNMEISLPVRIQAEVFGEYEETFVAEGTVNPETRQVEGDLTALKTTTQVSYSCKYEQFKQLLNYVYSNDSKMTISSLKATYDPDLCIIKGSFTFDEYAIIGSGRSVDTLDIPELDRGHNTNPFTLYERVWKNEFGDRVDGEENKEDEE